MAFITVEDDNVFATIETGPLTRVILTDLTHNVSGVGYAKLNHPDVYNEQFGIELATVRATERLSRKVRKELIKSLG